MNKDLLIKFDTYQNMPQHPVPYVYTVSNGTQDLYYFGTKHSNDITQPHFAELKKFFEEFVSKTAGKDRIVLIEGGIWPVAESEEIAISRFGEMAFVTYLAAKQHIDRACPEPSTRLLYEELEKHFSRDDIQFYYFARTCYQWSRGNKQVVFEDYIKGFLEDDRKQSGWTDFDFSLDHMKELHQKNFGTEFDPQDIIFWRSIVNPTKTTTIFNAISRFEDEEFRDVYIVNNIEKYWREGKSIFVVYGSSHAFIQEPALRTLSEI